MRRRGLYDGSFQNLLFWKLYFLDPPFPYTAALMYWHNVSHNKLSLMDRIYQKALAYIKIEGVVWIRQMLVRTIIIWETRHVFVKHRCPRRQQSQTMAKISKSYILTLSLPLALFLPPGACDISEVWATLRWTYSPSLVTVWPPKL